MKSILKEAATKAVKLYRAGKLSPEAYNRLFDKIPVKDNIHNKINARAIRAARGLRPKGKMDLKRYLKMSKTDVIKRMPLESISRRKMKFQGRQNRKIISDLRKMTGGNVQVAKKFVPGELMGAIYPKIDAGSGKLTDLLIELPTPKEELHRGKVPKKFLPRGIESLKRLKKEDRALTARHEIAGESVEATRIARAAVEEGVPAYQDVANLFSMGTHISPHVLEGDMKFRKSLSPGAASLDKAFRKKSESGWTTNCHKDLSESQFLNFLKQPNFDVAHKNVDRLMRAPSVPATPRELRNQLVNKGIMQRDKYYRWTMATPWSSRGAELTDEHIGRIADRVMNSPLFRYR